MEFIDGAALEKLIRTITNKDYTSYLQRLLEPDHS
jgi:hypothetical protein